ncbi:glycine betaine/L-proline ABC transporter ATP-binding protein [Tessaracoccus terricola]
MADNEIQLRAESLYKVFGRSGESAIRKLEAGVDRDDLGEGTTAAVIDASFEVRKGEIFVVMGLSGSGKSTLIRMLNGLLEPTRGVVKIGGEPLTGIPKAKLREIRRRRVSMVFQHFGLLPHRSVIDNVAYGLEIQGKSRRERLARAREVIQLVGLSGWEKNLPSELSGGMRQRVGLARALASDTDVLLMDEAFSALDPLIRREMQEQLLDLQSRLGKTIIFITHDLNEAMFLGERIAVMRNGRIVQIGAPEEILTDPANDYVAQFVQDVDRARVLTAGAVMEQPLAVVQESAGPRAALRVMRDEQTSAAFVVGRDRRLLGAITDRKALELVRAGKPTTAADLMEAAHVDAATTIAELVTPAIESPLPLAVTDERGHLIGVVPRVTLLAALGGEDASEAVAAQVITPLPAATVETALVAAENEEGGL